jgi:DNA polymerase-3 subunit delta'
VPAAQLLQRSLERGRLAHAFLLTGERLDEVEMMARTLAKTLCCQRPPRQSPAGTPLDCCDTCLSCRKIAHDNHADIHWVRPESKLRIIKIEQIRELIRIVNLKPTEAGYKVAVLEAADRLTEEAANAFLKTLEEPPPKSVLLLLTTEPQRLLETILSRCLRLNLSAGTQRPADPKILQWVADFSAQAATEQKSLLNRYRLLGALLSQLAAVKSEIEANLKARSPLERYEDLEPVLQDKLEKELDAAIEAEYRRQRMEWLAGLHWWLRDVWLHSLAAAPDLLSFPKFSSATRTVASRISPADATVNLQVLDKTQRLLHTNVQEALILEVGLLKLKL